MRVSFVLPCADFPGGFRVLAIHAQGLAERGHEVVVTSLPLKQLPWRRRVKDFVRGSGVRSRGSHLDGIEGVTHRILETHRPIRPEDLPEADIVIATWWETAEWVGALPDRCGAKAYFIQGYETWGGEPERVKQTYRMPMSQLVVSRWLETTMRQEFGSEDVTLIPNAVDPRLFHAPRRTRQSVPTVGLIYTTVACKGYETGRRAIERMKQEMPGLKAIAFGTAEVADSLPLPAGCHYTKKPAQQQLRELYASCDVWLYTSRSEGFGLPVLEAMACRTPVVGTRAGAAPELISERGAGELVDVDEPEQMAQAALRVLRKSPEEWQAMSDAAAETAAAYEWSGSTRRLEEALRRIAARENAGVAAAGSGR